MFPRLLALFIVVPIVELFLLLSIGARIGPWLTLGIIISTAFIGATLTKMQGAMTMLRAQKALSEGRMPGREALDGLMIIIAGVVLLTPGFLTDAFGFALLIPSVRAVCRKYLAKALKKRMQFSDTTVAPANQGGSGRFDDDNVIEAELIEDDK